MASAPQMIPPAVETPKAALEQWEIGGWTQAIDDAMDDRHEKLGLVVEAMVERAF